MPAVAARPDGRRCPGEQRAGGGVEGGQLGPRLAPGRADDGVEDAAHVEPVPGQGQRPHPAPQSGVEGGVDRPGGDVDAGQLGERLPADVAEVATDVELRSVA